MTMITVLAVLVVIALLLIPALIAFKRRLKYRWVILVLSLVPCYSLTWFAALIWAIWPKNKS